MNAHPKADLLQQLADEAMINPEPWRAFEWRRRRDDQWRAHDSMHNLLNIVKSIVVAHEIDCVPRYDLRRKPDAIRVSGEVAYEVIDLARGAISDYSSAKGPERTLARALLSLVEEAE